LLLAVDLDDIGEALDQSSAIVSYIDLANEMKWPGELFDIDQGPEDFDEDDSNRWLPVVGGGFKGCLRRDGAIHLNDRQPWTRFSAAGRDQQVRRLSTLPSRAPPPRRAVHALASLP